MSKKSNKCEDIDIMTFDVSNISPNEYDHYYKLVMNQLVFFNQLDKLDTKKTIVIKTN